MKKGKTQEFVEAAIPEADYTGTVRGVQAPTTKLYRTAYVAFEEQLPGGEAKDRSLTAIQPSVIAELKDAADNKGLVTVTTGGPGSGDVKTITRVRPQNSG